MMVISLYQILLFALSSSASVLVDFQVAQPPPLPRDAKQCTSQILEHTFGFSFGQPKIVQYIPPTDCGTPGSWTGISLNMTVTSNGTQFDRLGVFTFQNVEIWRTSTPEPTSGDGIIWTYLKDVTRYTPLFAKAGTFMLELDNLVEPGLDGQYATTVSATFFASSLKHPATGQANTIIPISTLSNTSANDASVPPAFSLNITLPRNTIQIYAELYASGNANEEFWYYNAANEFISSLPPGTTFGQGPFREVRLLIDGRVAGAAFPYATIFTGGILPTAWRPITSYGALDLPTYFLDLTPFVPVLTDGNPHNFTLDVASAETDHAINGNWFVSGLLQVITDSSSKPTTGNITSYSAEPYATTRTTGSVSANGDVIIIVDASRQIHIEAEILSGSGHRTNAAWSQKLEFSNTQFYLKNTTIQNVVQTSSGEVLSTLNGVLSVMDTFSYPLNINLTSLDPNGSSFVASFDHSYDRVLLPSPFILGSTIRERQLAGGFFSTTLTENNGNGTSNNTFSYSDLAGNAYNREVDASLNVITYDHQGGTLAQSRTPNSVPPTVGSFGVARLPGGKVVLGPGLRV